ncbi:hypothetical protein DFJ67_5999 [Asanoa ferruginea]|uniref:Uncharacterized protein n=1 Tax=Asanoa ferruginea TaxID=53367 RepID=A0A3D9ZU11_9ACTN|nr:hypothetical protein [Asanoa ferruginea]REF99952.1 hypothetical protein DFJ67_5999 [Asanoa ferruginea]GIF53172.1 hypothetical protein Afe04nite_77110 [Asanoa ferruginea]
MASVTSWTRLEPTSRSRAMTGFAARVGDPLWLLARQWQLGELTGSDGGSPTQVDLVVETARLTRYRPGMPDGTLGQPLDPRLPLESVVEAETVAGPADDRAAAVAGADLLRRLGELGQSLVDAAAPPVDAAAPPVDAAAPPVDAVVPEHGEGRSAAVAGGDALRRGGDLRQALVDAYRLPVPPADADPAVRRRAELLRRRVPDGRLLFTALRKARDGGDVSTALPLDRGDPKAVEAARRAASEWLDAWEVGAPVAAGGSPPAWRPESVDYGFAVAAAGPGAERVLVADGYAGERIDWWSLDAAPGAALGASRDGAVRRIASATLPTRVAGAGLPASRFWAFEPGDVNLDAVSAAPEDLGRLLFTEFAVAFGNDYFVVPVEVEVGSVTSVVSLTVTTTFGETVAVPSGVAADTAAGRRPVRMFQPTSNGGGAEPWLVVPPGGVSPLAGEAVEDVLLSIDEMANLAWAIERRVPGIDGRGAERAEALHRAPTEPAEPRPGPWYRLATSVAANWLPMVRSTTGRPVLRLTGMPHGRLLRAGGELNAERLGRAGIRLTRRAARARSIDGRTVVWMARRSEPGRGESTSGLRFDSIVDD